MFIEIKIGESKTYTDNIFSNATLAMFNIQR